jgi:hypothetical protein
MANDKYKPEYCQLLVDHMKDGMSYDSFPARVYDEHSCYVGLSTIYDWEARLPEWKEAKEIAFAKSLQFYEKRASAKVIGKEVEGIVAKDIDSYVLMGMLKTRFHKIYGDKSTVQHDVTEDAKEGLRLAYSLKD